MKFIFTLALSVPFFAFTQGNTAFSEYKKATTFYNQSQFDSAIYHFDRSLALDSNFHFAFYNRGLCFEKMDSIEPAINDFTSVISLDKAFIEAYQHRAILNFKSGDYRNAGADYLMLDSLEVLSDMEKNKLGLCYFYQRKYIAANEVFIELLKDDDENITLRYQYALSLFYYADFEGAIKQSTKVLNEDDTAMNALVLRGEAYQKANYLRKACLDWKEAAENNYVPATQFLKDYCN